MPLEHARTVAAARVAPASRDQPGQRRTRRQEAAALHAEQFGDTPVQR